MPIENVTSGVFEFLNVAFALKAFLILFLIFYVIFSLILYRQIQVMSKTLPTSVVPFIKFIGIIHLGVALALLLIAIGVF